MSSILGEVLVNKFKMNEDGSEEVLSELDS